VKKPVDTVNHFVMFQQIATTGRNSSFLNGGDEARLILQQPVNGFFNQLFGVFAGAYGVLSETGFFLWVQMDFHAPSG
jgi:hypothetical protein